MTIEKRTNGSYRIRHTENKKTYSVTVPYRPNLKQAYLLIQEKMGDNPDAHMTFEAAAHKYIEVKENVLSPSTIRGYLAILRNMPPLFTAYDISSIDDYKLQAFINDFASTHSPKSVKNAYGFVRAVIRLFIPKSDICATLPQNVHTEAYSPSLEDVKRIFEAAYPTEHYVGLRLAAMSLRRSEICALSLDDLDGDTLTINKSLVPSVDGYVLKPCPKTDASNRTVVIPHDLAERIREQGYIYNYQPNSLDQYLRRLLPRLGIPHFSLHKLRHFFASYAHDLGYSDAVIQSIGGWSTDHVMKSVYRHAMNADEAKKNIASDFSF